MIQNVGNRLGAQWVVSSSPNKWNDPYRSACIYPNWSTTMNRSKQKWTRVICDRLHLTCNFLIHWPVLMYLWYIESKKFWSTTLWSTDQYSCICNKLNPQHLIHWPVFMYLWYIESTTFDPLVSTHVFVIHWTCNHYSADQLLYS